jgi:hypothetical protein
MYEAGDALVIVAPLPAIMPDDRLGAAGHELTVLGKAKGVAVKDKKGRESFVTDADPDQVRADEFDAACEAILRLP